jgi:hypothetical protein
MEKFISYFELSYKVLDQAHRPLTPKEIWEESEKSGLSKDLKSISDKPWNSIKSVIYKDINNNTQSHFCSSEGDPDKYTLKKYIQKKEDSYHVNRVPDTIYEEYLHKILCAFVKENNHFRCSVKTINQNRGVNPKSGLNKWAYPDMVGIHIPNGLHKVTSVLQKELSEFSYRLFSFELKLQLSINDLRESYFQAVSNSSWANEGYLVTMDIIDEDNIVDNEMALLNNAFGIGIIQLNIKNIIDSKILYPCRSDKPLDWLIINKLVENNTDFRTFIEDITLLVKNERGEVHFDIAKDIIELEDKSKSFF